MARPDNDQSRINANMTAAEAALSERVSHQGRRLTDLEVEMRTGFSSLQTSVTSLANETRAALQTMTANLADRNKTQWPVLISALTLTFGFLVYFMTQAIGPVREDQSDLKQVVATLAADTNASIRSLASQSITRQEMDWRSERASEDRVRHEEAIKDLRATMLPRNEWNEKNQSRDHDIDNIREIQTREATNTQRQIDLLRQDFQTFASSLGNGRDFINDLKEEVSRLRDQLAEIRARQYQRLGSPPS